MSVQCQAAQLTHSMLTGKFQAYDAAAPALAMAGMAFMKVLR